MTTTTFTIGQRVINKSTGIGWKVLEVIDADTVVLCHGPLDAPTLKRTTKAKNIKAA